ncbi:MAG: SEL1-like repeat protein [Nitrospina sp.]|jgi:TPR repeat protein|nr:SEL1-like repeat protein [Nitrospina sp.]
MLYFEGKWVLKDYKEGVKWIRLAAEQGHAQPKNAWGSFIEMGKG